MEQICPILKGAGFAIMVAVSLLNMYFCVIVAWSLFYFIASFVSIPDLPWSGCNHYWNTKYCYDKDENFTESWLYSHNLSISDSDIPVEEFWERRVLQMSDGIDTMGTINWELFGTLLGAWVVSYLIVRRGLFNNGKVVWFMAIFPYIILVILFGRAVSLEGAVDGLQFLVTPNWTKLQDAETWLDGGTQIFYSFGVALGPLTALGSYNQFHHNGIKDALTVCSINMGTSLFAGTVTFSVLGHMAHVYHTSVSEVVKSGPGLIYLAYPEVLALIPGAPFWSAIFFTMMVILGVNSIICQVEGTVVGMCDNWPKFLRPKRNYFTFFLVIVLFVMGIPMITNGGIYLFSLMDFYSSSGITILSISFCEIVAMAWVFGSDNVEVCMKQMFGRGHYFWWKLCWKYFAPAIILSILAVYCVMWEPLSFDKNYVFPGWSQALGWCICASSLICIPSYGVYFLATSPEKTFMQKLRKGFTPKLTLRPEALEELLSKDESSILNTDPNGIKFKEFLLKHIDSRE